MRRISLAAGAAVAAASLTLAPVAGAQTNSLELITLVNGNIAAADCTLVESALTGLGLVDETTTRGELVAELNARAGNDIALKVLLGGSINALGDRALECGIVQEDPEEDFLTTLLNSSANGGVDAFLPALTEMSSLG